MVLADLNMQKSARGQVIEILNRKFPLTAKQIHNRIKKFGISKTYHGIYDCVQEMVNQGVLVKEDRKYHLDDRWIRSICITMERIQVRQIVGSVMEGIEKEDMKTVTFKSYKNYVKFIRGYMNHFIETADPTKKNKICWLLDHAVRGIYNTESNAKFARQMKEKNIELFVAVNGNSTLDRFVKIIYETMGMKNMVLGAPNKFGMPIAIYNDIAICTLIPENVVARRNELYEETNSINNNSFKLPVHIAKISNYLESLETEVKVIIIKNSALVNEYKKYIFSFFKEGN